MTLAIHPNGTPNLWGKKKKKKKINKERYEEFLKLSNAYI